MKSTENRGNRKNCREKVSTGLLLLLLAAALLAVPFAAQVGIGAYSVDAPAFSPPLIHPGKVLPGDVMTVTAEVSSGLSIKSVTADMGENV